LLPPILAPRGGFDCKAEVASCQFARELPGGSLRAATAAAYGVVELQQPVWVAAAAFD
jgi:hypothetical protein